MSRRPQYVTVTLTETQWLAVEKAADRGCNTHDGALQLLGSQQGVRAFRDGMRKLRGALRAAGSYDREIERERMRS